MKIENLETMLRGALGAQQLMISEVPNTYSKIHLSAMWELEWDNISIDAKQKTHEETFVSLWKKIIEPLASLFQITNEKEIAMLRYQLDEAEKKYQQKRNEYEELHLVHQSYAKGVEDAAGGR